MGLVRKFSGWLLVTAVALGCLWMANQVLRRSPPPGVPGLQPLVVQAAPVALGAPQLGQMRFRGALVLQSANPAFGGLSGLAAGPGGQMLAVSDAGHWLAFQLVVRDGQLAGTRDWWLRGMPAASKSDVDIEALAWQPQAGTAQLSLEQNHRIMHVRLPIGAGNRALLAGLHAGRAEYLTPTMAWQLNLGGEALALLPGGARVLVAEASRRADGSCEALLTMAGRTRRIGLACPAGFRPTDAVALDATHLIVLHRRFTVQERASALTLVDMAPVLAGGAQAPMQLLARWGPPQLWDNFEGLALAQVGGERWLYLVSDNNFSLAQRNIIMALALPPALASTRSAGQP